MSQNNIAAALATHLTDLSGDYQIAYENADFTPPADEVYLAESLNPTTVEAMSLSATGSQILNGFYQVLCYAPRGATKGGALAAAGAVEAAFQKGDRLTYNGTEVTILRCERNPAFMSDDRYAIPLTIYYRAAM